MKKILCIIAAVSLCAFVGCSKPKDCKCTADQSFSGIDMNPMVTEYTQTIEKGKCEDLNTTSTTTMEGVVLTQVVKCSEK